MEIKNISSIMNTYNKVKMGGNKTKAAPVAAKTDKVEFNFARSVEAAKSNLATRILGWLMAAVSVAIAVAACVATGGIAVGAVAGAVVAETNAHTLENLYSNAYVSVKIVDVVGKVEE